MPKLTPNLHFTDQGTDAMALYERAFGAKTTQLYRYADANPKDFDQPLTDAQKACVYHAEMVLYGQRIMLSDTLAESPEGHIPVSLVITFDTADEVRAVYEVLSEGATIIHPMTESTYSDCFVSLIDRFGVRWELMTER